MPQMKMYLLAGNGSAADWWDDAVPHFSRYSPVPLELPGFGNNAQAPLADLQSYAQALLEQTQPGHAIFAVGVNALVVLHALQRNPGHFARTVLLAPVGVFLWQRALPKLMSPLLFRKMIHVLLARRPQWFARKFSARQWTPAQYQRMGRGYSCCRAFVPYWDFVQAHNALPLLDWIRDPIELVWGQQDAVLGVKQAAAWSAILARADLTVGIRSDWGHYPWIDDSLSFVRWLESGEKGFVAHTKGGRLQLAQIAGASVPAALSVSTVDDLRLHQWLQQEPKALWAVRSSSYAEDQADAARAGLSTTWLRQVSRDVPSKVHALLADGVEEVVVQRFVEPLVSGIAFVRHLGIEVEWVQGHLDALASGSCQPQHAVISRIGGSWGEGAFTPLLGLTQAKLRQFLNKILGIFHYVHGDVEWAWDGQEIWLLQYRPITSYSWRRHLTAANIAEILPAQPSRLVEYAQRRAAHSIPAVMALWDTRVLQDNEPFTALYGNASYINNDGFLARMSDWGLPSQSYAGEVGGAVPRLPLHWGKLLRSLPRFLILQHRSRKALAGLESQLQAFDSELSALAHQTLPHSQKAQALADWYTRFYVFVVQGNLCIANAIASSGGSVLGKPVTVYGDMRDVPHRMPWETDPATPRPSLPALLLQPFPVWSRRIQTAHALGLPGLRGYYIQIREWYRDNVMRIFFRLHHAMPESKRAYWFAPHEDARTQLGGFWQDGYCGNEVDDAFVIYPGAVEGVLGEDVLLVDTLDPGLYANYQKAAAVITRMGGRLSHGATLLRELNKPSAVMPQVDPDWMGQRVRYANATLSLLPPASLLRHSDPELAPSGGRDSHGTGCGGGGDA